MHPTHEQCCDREIDERAGEHADLPRPPISNDWNKPNRPRDAVQELRTNQHAPDGESTNQHSPRIRILILTLSWRRRVWPAVGKNVRITISHPTFRDQTLINTH